MGQEQTYSTAPYRSLQCACEHSGDALFLDVDLFFRERITPEVSKGPRISTGQDEIFPIMWSMTQYFSVAYYCSTVVQVSRECSYRNVQQVYAYHTECDTL